jgi:Protein of unknown function (DUF2971)
MWRHKFVECLEGSTLRNSRMAGALAIKQQNLPKRIYKYRCDCKYSLDNLKNNTVWLGSPDSYNDPYDCAFKLSDDGLVAALKKRLVDAFVGSYQLQNVVSAEQINNAKNNPEPLETIVSYIPPEFVMARGSNPKRMSEYCSDVVPGLVSDALLTVREWRKLTKLCSFSAINDSVLMWSHYAGQHQGFCVEYDLESLKPDDPFRKYLFPVIYSNHLYDLTPWAEKLAIPDRQQFNPDSPLLGVLHKFDGWKYEEEWRLVSVALTVTGDHNFPAPAPSRIFLGSKLRAEEHKELVSLCEEKKIEVYKMRLANDRFELLPERFSG